MCGRMYIFLTPSAHKHDKLYRMAFSSYCKFSMALFHLLPFQFFRLPALMNVTENVEAFSFWRIEIWVNAGEEEGDMYTVLLVWISIMTHSRAAFYFHRRETEKLKGICTIKFIDFLDSLCPAVSYWNLIFKVKKFIGRDFEDIYVQNGFGLQAETKPKFNHLIEKVFINFSFRPFSSPFNPPPLHLALLSNKY